MQVKCFDSSAGRYHFVLEGIVTSSHAHPVAEVILAREGTFDLSLGELSLSRLRFDLTRMFCQQLGYEKEAVIRDFWDTGDDKVTFRKVLG